MGFGKVSYFSVILSLLLSLLQLPLYLIVSLGCYGLLMVGVGLMNFPTCPQEALFLQQVQLHFSFKKYCIPMLLELFKNVDGLVQDPPEVEGG